jgi:hypothetical protein
MNPATSMLETSKARLKREGARGVFVRSSLFAFAAIPVLSSPVGSAPRLGLTVADVLAKSDALQTKGMLAIFSSDLGLIKAEAKRDIDAFAAAMQAAHREHRPLPACPPQDVNGWKFNFNTDEVLKFYRSIPPRQRAMSSIQGFFEYMTVKYPCR